MFTYNDPTATAGGEFTDGDPLAVPPVPRTVLRSIWTNMIQRELINLVEGAGLTLDGADFTQVLQAVTDIAQAEADASSSQVIPTGTVWDHASTTAPSGWLSLNGDTIGATGSGADHAGDVHEALYAMLWDEFSDTDCPVTGGRGASAAADWAADKPLAIPDDRGLARRGYDPTGAVDPDGATRGFGSYQEDEFAEHSHLVPRGSSIGAGPYKLQDNQNDNGDQPTGTAGGAETRMKNRAYTPIIKI